ncbi:hypothetical protein D3C73_1279460 [compost metagenome]
MGDERAIDQHVQRLAGQAIKLDHRTLVQLQQVADVDVGAAHFHGNRHRNIENHVEVRAIERDRIVVSRHAAELFHWQAVGRGTARIGSQQGVDVSLPGIAGFFQGRSPLIGQRLVVLHVHIVSHDVSSASKNSEFG